MRSGNHYEIMKRRNFLLGAGTLALSNLMAGCDTNSATTRVRLLKNSIPAQLLNEFKKVLERPVNLDFALEDQLKDCYTNLQTWKTQGNIQSSWQQWLPFTPKVPIIADLITLGDYWLASAIEQKLIQPLDWTAQLTQWARVPPRWQELVKRNDQGQLDPNGKVWGAPYRWGSTVIAYRRDKFKSLGWEPTDWSDLWRPELRDRISLLNQPREVIGLTLKKLGHSYNTQDLNRISDLKAALQKLHQQVKLYSSNTYLQPLVLGDTWLAVGWSADVLLAQKREPEIVAVVPKSGTALWSDVWVRPIAASSDIKLLGEWIDFCWQPTTANQISLFSSATSPVSVHLNPADLPKDLRNNPLRLPDTRVLDNSEFLYPLPPSTIEQYRSLWQTIHT